ncbi:hypothetical protein D3C72_1268450 [compost metagenome]
MHDNGAELPAARDAEAVVDAHGLARGGGDAGGDDIGGAPPDLGLGMFRELGDQPVVLGGEAGRPAGRRAGLADLKRGVDIGLGIELQPAETTGHIHVEIAGGAQGVPDLVHGTTQAFGLGRGGGDHGLQRRDPRRQFSRGQGGDRLGRQKIVADRNAPVRERFARHVFILPCGRSSSRRGAMNVK